MAHFIKAAFAAASLAIAVSSVVLLTGVEAQTTSFPLTNLCSKLPQKGGTRCIVIEVKPINAEGLPIVISEAKVPKCLWVNYKSLRKNSKYKFEGKPAGWRGQVKETDLIARCPNTSFTQTATYASKLISVRAQLQEK